MTTITTLDTPKLEKQKTDSLLLTIDIPADFDGEYRIQYYQAGYMYSGNWHTQAISPGSVADLAVPTRSSWDADNKPVFVQRVPYQLRPLEPNKCYVVRTGMKNEKGKWVNSAKSAYMYTLAKDGEKSDLEKSLVMEKDGSACDAPGDEEEEQSSPAPPDTDPNSAEAGWTPVTHPGAPTSTSAIDSVMITSTDTLGSSDSDLDSLTDGGAGAGAGAGASAPCSSPPAHAEGAGTGAETPTASSSALSGSGAEAGVETSRNDNEELERLRKQLESHATTQVAQETELAAARVKLEAAERLQREAAAAHGREMEAVKAQVQAEVETAKAQQARDHDAAVEAAIAAAVSKKEAEMQSAFESMLKDGEEQKRALEASSAQLAEGQLRSVQAALEEERGSARRAEDAQQELVAELERVRVAVRAREAELAEARAGRETLEKEVGELKEALAQAQAQALPPPPPYHADRSSTMIATPVVADADAVDTLAFKRFSSGDLALFLPVPTAENGGGGGAADGQQAETALMAFHSGCPHHYISEDSLEAVRGEDGSMPTFFVGRVLMVEDHSAGAAGGVGNPYNLPVGTEYHTLIVEKYE